MVDLVKKYKKAVTLAIGDGANDVGMIKGGSLRGCSRLACELLCMQLCALIVCLKPEIIASRCNCK